MKRPSLPTLAGIATALSAVIRRFPGTMLVAVAGVGASITLVEIEAGSDHLAAGWLAGRVLLAAFIGLPLTLALRLMGEARGSTRAQGWWLDAVGLLAALVYGLGLPASHQNIHEALFIRTAILALGMHFLVALAPALRPGDEAEFWEFNWRLFLRLCLGALYSAVLYVGLAVAIGSANQLFDLKIKPQRYVELWMVIVGLFNTCFFAHGVPSGAAAAKASDYPRGLRMFAQFALAPLVVAYLGILYPYAAKIVLLREWPRGWVSLPILCLAVVGILAALFLHPIREQTEERWTTWYWKWFFRAFLPLTVLLYLAVRVRTGEYGITESRYFGFVLAGWLALVSAYFWWPANRSIRWLPASLALLCLGCTWGPWGAFAVSENSQFARLQERLAVHGLLVGGILTPKTQLLEPKEYTDLQSMLRYLRSRHDSVQLARLLAAPRSAGAQADQRRSAMNVAWNEPEDVLRWLGVKRSTGKPGRFNLQIDGPGEVTGYTTARVIWQMNRWTVEDKAPGSGPRFELDRESGALFARTATGRIELKTVVDALAKVTVEPQVGEPIRLPWKQMSVPMTFEGNDYLLVMLQAAGQRTDAGRIELDSLTLMVLAR